MELGDACRRSPEGGLDADAVDSGALAGASRGGASAGHWSASAAATAVLTVLRGQRASGHTRQKKVVVEKVDKQLLMKGTHINSEGSATCRRRFGSHKDAHKSYKLDPESLGETFRNSSLEHV